MIGLHRKLVSSPHSRSADIHQSCWIANFIGVRYRIRGASFLLIALISTETAWSGTVVGQGRFERIAGNPSMGYTSLYEWDLFLSPSDDSMLGPSRRLGAPPGQSPTGDGYYRIDHIPAGDYSIYVNQPDFFASPQVVPDIRVPDTGLVHVNVDLDVDYSTYFRDSGQWTDWQWDRYQTFTATGTAIRGISWVMAGWGLYQDKTARVRVLEDNGNPDVRQWRRIGERTDGNLASDSDEWVRWISGDVPITPGTRYAVNIHIDGGMAIYKRDKDARSYQGGQAYDQNGNPSNFDLCITVFTDHDEQVTHTTLSPGPGAFVGELFDTRWSQSFVAAGSSLAAADLFAASGMSDLELTWRIRRDGPDGPQIGPTKRTQGAYFASTTDLVGVSYNPGEVPLIPGKTYYIEATQLAGFTPFVMQPGERYQDGTAFQNGSPTTYDLSMTIVEYPIPEPPSSILMLTTLLPWVLLLRSPAFWKCRAS
ncbi:MAG: carboxypeptidase regulatory-like domain-containing protein [Pirellulales bacterium]|nr:carboxypeptidase regulatory-like domain-containing protein [Pirellulales bacterium]